MKLPGKATIATNVLALLFLLFLYVGDLVDYARAQTAEVSAMSRLPNVVFAVIVLAAAAVVVGMLAMKLVKGADPKDRVFRLLPIVAVIGVFVDLFVLSADDALINPADQMSISLQLFSKAAAERGSTTQVPTAERDLAEIVKEFGSPPYLVKGRPAEHYAVQRRENCDGPVADAPGAQVGTFIYCIAKDRQTAWVSVVALPYEERFGVPKVLSRDGRPMVGVVTPVVPEDDETMDGSLPFENVLMPVDGGI